MAENVARFKSGKMINMDVSAKTQKTIMHAKRIIFGVLQHVVTKILNVYQVLLTIQWLRVMKL